jgi:predicted unusual protein kinase regulating ubiquinone biosynthesis (AarF/ABC1/UbiB family)
MVIITFQDFENTPVTTASYKAKATRLKHYGKSAVVKVIHYGISKSQEFLEN